MQHELFTTAKRPRSSHPPDQRVELFLGGVHTSSTSVVAAFLKRISKVNGEPFNGVVRVSGVSSCARATLIGPHAGPAAAVALGKRLEYDRPLEEVKLHNDWYCLCRGYGEQLLRRSLCCPHCSRTRNEALLTALSLPTSGGGDGPSASHTATVGHPEAVAVPCFATEVNDPPMEPGKTVHHRSVIPSMGVAVQSVGAAHPPPLLQHPSSAHRVPLLSISPMQPSSRSPREDQTTLVPKSLPSHQLGVCSPDEAWDIVAGRGALTWKDSRLTIYRRLDACLEMCKQNGNRSPRPFQDELILE